MKRNPNYRGEPYPCEGMPGDKEAGLLDDCGKTTPFVDTLVFTVEREGTPQRNKFRQGYLRRRGLRAHRHGHRLPASRCRTPTRCAPITRSKGFHFPQ